MGAGSDTLGLTRWSHDARHWKRKAVSHSSKPTSSDKLDPTMYHLLTCAVAWVGLRRMHRVSLTLCALDALGSSVVCLFCSCKVIDVCLALKTRRFDGHSAG